MSNAQERFIEAMNDIDRAYWQGALDGEAAERERIVELLANNMLSFQETPEGVHSVQFTGNIFNMINEGEE